MSLRIVPGSANPGLAGAIAKMLGTEPVPGELARFPDGELRPVVGHLRARDVYVVQPTGPPVSDHLLELFLLLDACRRAGAGRITRSCRISGMRGRTAAASPASPPAPGSSPTPWPLPVPSGWS